MEFQVPTVDLGPWVQGGTDRDRAASAAKLDASLREFSVVQLSGHGIPDSIVASIGTAVDEVFDLPPESKQQLVAGAGLNRGFSAAGTESLITTLGIRDRPNDYFESFTVGALRHDYPHARPRGPEYAENVWPDLPDFRRRTDLYFDEAGRVARTVNEVIGAALGIGRRALDPFVDHSVDTMRFVRYSEHHRVDPDADGMSAHTDFGLTTVQWSDPLPGLEIVGRDRAWHPVVRQAGTLLLFVGDLLARLTDDRWLPTLHRVRPPVVDGQITPRRAVVFYHDGNSEAIIEPFEALRDPTRTTRPAPVTVAENVRAKLAISRWETGYDATDADRARLPIE